MPNTRSVQRPTKLDKVHRFDPEEEDRCRCGGEWVYFEPLLDTDGDTSGWGYGCDVVGRPARPEDGFRGPVRWIDEGGGNWHLEMTVGDPDEEDPE